MSQSEQMTKTSSTGSEDPLYEPTETETGVDLSKLSPQELKIYKLYGKLPRTNELLQGRLKDRQFFDSGDYMMSKASGQKPAVAANPLRMPNIESVARINRNSFSGSTAPVVLGLNQQKSKLEEDSTEAVLDDDEEEASH